MSHEPSHPLSQPLALVLFSHQFATLLNCGVSVPHALDVLQEAPAPYGEAARDLRPEVERGIALSQAMATQPTLFSPFYRGMVRAGEVGDMLEDTLRRVADLITKEWKLAPGCPGQGEQVSLLLSGSQPVPGDWGELSPYQQTVLLLLFCETFGLLLVSGVPILQSMEIVAELLSPKEREGLLAAREEVKVGQSLIPGLERLGILPRVAIELITVGFEGGNLDVTLERAAGIFQHELECRLIGSPR